MAAGELEDLHAKARERSASFELDTRIRLAMDMGLRNGEAIGELRAENKQMRNDVAEIKGDIKGVLEKLGELTAVRPIDRWLQRIALLAVSSAGLSIVAWLLYQAWQGTR